MAFKMKGYPMHKGTAKHMEASAAFQKKAAAAAKREASAAFQETTSPMTKKSIEKLLEQRAKLRKIREERIAAGKDTTLIDKRIEMNQKKINDNPTAQEWREQGKKATEESNIGVRQDPPDPELYYLEDGPPNGEGSFKKNKGKKTREEAHGTGHGSAGKSQEGEWVEPETSTEPTLEGVNVLPEAEVVTEKPTRKEKRKEKRKDWKEEGGGKDQYQAAMAQYKADLKAWKEGGKSGDKPVKPKRKDFK